MAHLDSILLCHMHNPSSILAPVALKEALVLWPLFIFTFCLCFYLSLSPKKKVYANRNTTQVVCVCMCWSLMHIWFHWSWANYSILFTLYGGERQREESSLSISLAFGTSSGAIHSVPWSQMQIFVQGKAHDSPGDSSLVLLSIFNVRNSGNNSIWNSLSTYKAQGYCNFFTWV